MREWVGAIETLADACRARRRLWALCLACGHSRRLDPWRLVIAAGPLTLRQLKGRLRCDRCGQRRAHLVPDDEPLPGRND